MAEKTARREYLGKIGEEIAMEVLVNNEYQNVINLNKIYPNIKFCDVYAEKNGFKYIFSVKARNKFEFDKKRHAFRLNSRYKLGNKCHLFAEEQKFKFNAIPAWITISLDKKTYSAYLGLMSELKGNTGVNMTQKATENYTILAINQTHLYDYSMYTNIY